MSQAEPNEFTRRRFLSGTTALGAASLLGWPAILQAEPPPETRKIRIVRSPDICILPAYLAEELLRLEGFSEVEFLSYDVPNANHTKLIAQQADFAIETPPGFIPALDSGEPLVTIAGIHGGCYELFANDRVKAVRDLKGKRVAIGLRQSSEYYFIASMLAYVGMNPSDVQWIETKAYGEPLRYFVDGRVDAFLAFPPEPQQLRAKKIGQVILDTSQDRPWANYYCCMLISRPDFVNNNPIATKRATRAMLKAADICASDPERVAKFAVSKGIGPSYEVALEVMRSLSYNRWRSHSIEDSMRFFSLRMREVGIIKMTPQQVISKGTDLRFLNELKLELKA